MAIHKTEAIVLRTTKLRETSYIITFFSRDFGKFQAIAKGVRQPGSPWAGLYEPLNRLEIIFYEKLRSDILLATEATGLDLRWDLRKNFKAITFAYYLTEVLESFSNVGESDEEYWTLIERAYGLLSESPLLVSCIFQLKILHRSGFFPDLAALEETEGPNVLADTFSSYVTQLVQKTHVPTLFKEKPALQNIQILQHFRYLLKEDWEKAFRLQITPKLLEEAEGTLAWLIALKLEKKLKTRRFLEELAYTHSI